jgi:hypothetical protein
MSSMEGYYDMDYEEYYDGEDIDDEDYDDDDDEGEFGDTFLSSENADGDINIIIIPKFEFDPEEFVQFHLDMLRKCKTNDDAFNVLYRMFAKTQIMSIITNASNDIQNRARELESLIEEYSS